MAYDAPKPAPLLAYESRVTSYSAGRTAWTKVHALDDGGYRVTKCWEWYDRNGGLDRDVEIEHYATRAAAFAAAGIADPLIGTVQAVAS